MRMWEAESGVCARLAGVDRGEGRVVGVDDHVLAVDGHAVQAQVEVSRRAPGTLQVGIVPGEALGNWDCTLAFSGGSVGFEPGQGPTMCF